MQSDARQVWRASRWRNQVQTVGLALGQVALVGVSAWLVLGGVGLALVAALGFAVASQAAKWARPTLEAMGAQPLRPWQVPWLHRALAALARRAGMARPPALYLIGDRRPNAMAMGEGDKAAIALTTGLLEVMEPRQLLGILAHELSHLRQQDALLQALSMMGARLVGALMQAALWLTLLGLPLALLKVVLVPWYALLWLLVAAPVSGLIGLGLSRVREFRADLEAVQLTGDPVGLASALHRLEVAPLGWLGRLLGVWGVRVGPRPPEHLSTHPHTARRIRRLMRLAEARGL
jgi:heat shock protein HtpX